MLRLISVLVLVLTIGVGNVWGADPTENIVLSDGSFSTDHITWSGTSCTIQQLKGSSGTNVNSSYISAPRVYKGHVLSFVAKTGYKIKSISIKVDGTYYGNSMTAGTTISSNTVTNNTTDVSRTWTSTSGGTHVVGSVNAAGLDAIYIQNVASTNVQLRFTKITITYVSSSPSYTITAQSNNTSYGTVSLSGTTITGSPKSGYRYASPAYSVSPANSATVSQSGNTFTVTPSANTTVTINFEAIPSHTVTWSANGTTTSNSYQEGAAISFPNTATGCTGGTFMGWAANAIDGTQATAPTYVTSANMGNADVTYYAVFATETAGAGGYEYIGDNTLLTASKTYIFVSSKSTGSAYAIKASDLPSSNGNATGVSVSITSVGGKATIATTNTNLEFLCNSHTDDRDALEEVANSGRLLVINGNGLGYAASGKAWYDEDGLHGCNSKCNTVYDVYHNGTNFIKAEGASYRVYAFIKKTTTYSDYRTSCCTELGSINGSFFWPTLFSYLTC